MLLGTTTFRACYVLGREVEGLPPISMERKAELDQMSIEQLQASIREATTVKARGRSIYRGITLHSGKWEARIRISGKTKHLGHYQTEEEAAHAYDRAAIAKDGRYIRSTRWFYHRLFSMSTQTAGMPWPDPLQCRTSVTHAHLISVI